MAADVSIYSMIRPMTPPPDPLQGFGQMVNLKGMIDQQGLADLQRRKLETDMSEEDAFKSAFRNSQDGKVNIQDLFRASPTRALQYQKTDLESQKLRGDIDKNQADVKLKQWEFLDKSHKANLQDLGGASDQASWERMRGNVYERMAGLAGPDAARAAVAKIPEMYSPEEQQRLMATGLTTAEQLARMKPDYKEVSIDNGGTITKQFVDTNPLTNPNIGKLNIVTQKVATPDAMLTDRRAREEGGLNRAQAERHFNAGGKQFDSERGMIVNTRTGEAQPVMQGGQPLAPKITEAQKKELSSIDAQVNTINGALDAVKATPDAFSFSRGTATLAGGIPESLAGKLDTPEQRQARAFVFNVVSKVINERAGAAQSSQELARLRSFLPAETDNAEQVTDKLNGFQEYLRLQRQAWEKPQNGQPSTPRPASPTPATGKPVPIKGDDGYAALPSGALFVGPDGVTRRKP